MKIFPANKTSDWHGGSTTEIYIYPEGATYQQRNFQFRISTATIEISESTFTSLPGIRRKIMILDGQIQLTHRGNYSKQLNKFDTDSFLGDWETVSLGYATDFNLMLTHPFEGEIIAKTLHSPDTFEIITPPDTFTILLYCHKGTAQCFGENLPEHWAAVITENEILKGIKIQPRNYCEVVFARVWKKV